MMSLTWYRRRLRSTRFVPTSLEGFVPARLESRALTAPAFWRQPFTFNNDPLSDIDWTQATANSAFAQPTDVTYDYQEYNASASSFSTNVSNTLATTLTMIGLATTDVVDLPQTLPPFAPIGTYGISADSTGSINVASSGAGEPVFNWFSLSAATQRTYALADDTITANANLVEHVSLFYNPGGVNIATMGAGAGSDIGLIAGIAGNATGITGAAINGVPITVPSTGSFTAANGAAITYSATTSTLSVDSTISVGTLPLAARAAFGYVQGIPINVSTGVGLATTIGNHDSSGIATVLSHYDAHLS